MFRRVIGGTVITGAAYYAAYAGILPWKHRPEASADDRMNPLPGDALVHSPTYTETSAIVINRAQHPAQAPADLLDAALADANLRIRLSPSDYTGRRAGIRLPRAHVDRSLTPDESPT